MTEPTLDSRDVFSPLPREDDDDDDVDGMGYKPAGESTGGADFIITRLTQTEKRDGSHGGLMVRAPGAKPACNACTRRFCLEQGLQICENAREEDVMTACFRELCPFISFLQPVLFPSGLSAAHSPMPCFPFLRWLRFCSTV